MRRSTDYGVTFQPALTDPPITVIQGINVIRGVGGYLPNGLRAYVIPAIKYNTASHSVMAAWHARTQPEQQNSNETALYFATFNADTISGPVSPITINDAPGTQMQPAIDNDDNGNILMTYFTTENHLPDNQYQLYGIGLSSSGQILAGCGPTPLDGTNAYPNGFLGDYHDNFYFTFPAPLGAVWNTSWSRYSGGFDAYVLGVK